MIPRSLLPLIVASVFILQASSQYVDFFEGLQTFFQPYQREGSVTKRPVNKNDNRRQGTQSDPAIVFPGEDFHIDRPKTSGTTPIPSRKNSRLSSQSTTKHKSENLSTSKYINTTPSYKTKPKSNENKRNDFGLFSSDSIFFPSDDVVTNSNRKTPQWGNKNDNRNPEVTQSKISVTTQWNNKNNRNPVVTTNNNKQNPVTASSTQWNNKNDNRNPSSAALTQWNNNRNPVVTSQWNNQNDRNPDVTSIKKPNNWNTNAGVTRKPVTIRPGVKPAPVDESKPPLTNKPVSPVFPDSSADGPELEIGPDEDGMSSVEKRQYLAVADEMCENYKSLNVKKVVALPLVPSSQGVEFNVSDCPSINVPLIIGGTISRIEEFPHMSLVGWKKLQSAGYLWKCGGTLVSDQYVLTAGHCTFLEKDSNVVSGPPHAVQLGSTNIDGPGAVVVRSSTVIRHPKYKLRRSYYDVALIKLVSRVQFSHSIRPACLGVPPPVGKPIIATGWGRTEFGGDQSLELRSVSLPIWDMQNCKEIWGTSLKLPNGPSSDSHVCAGERAGGKDTCQGDSGGPAQVRDGCVWRVVAVTSSGRSCGAPDTPALYAIVPRVFVAAQVFGKKSLNNRFDSLNTNSNNQQSNKNTNNQNFNQNNQNNRNTNNQNNREYYEVNNQNTNYNIQNNRNNHQNNRNQNNNNFNQQTTSNNLNQNTNQYYQDTNNHNQQHRVTTVRPSQLFNQNSFNQNQNNFNQNQNNYNQNQNNFNQNQNHYNQNQNNFNQNYNSNNQNQNYQNGYVTEGWNQNNNRGIDYNAANAFGFTERPWWSR